MKLTTNAGALAEALTLASKVIVKAPSLAVYSGAHLAVTAKGLQVTGSDEAGTSITITVEVTDAEPGSAILLPKPLSAYLATLPPTTRITLRADDATKVSIDAGGATPYTFRAMDATFPAPTAVKADSAPADLARLGDAVDAVRECAGTTKVVQLVSDDTGLRLHATDGQRLASAHLPEAGFGPFTGVLPLRNLEKVADAGITRVDVDRRGRVLTATGPTVSIVSRLLEQMFPSVDAILEARPPHTAVIPTAALRAALNRLASVADNRPLNVALNGDQMQLSVASANVGSGGETIQLEQPCTAEVSFGINMDYLAQAVAAHRCAEVTLAWSGPHAAVYLLTTEPFPVTTIVMPVRI